jgi:hypothetical protein
MNVLMAHAGLMDSAVYTASSEASGFPIENVDNIQPGTVWRSTGKASEYIVIDLGSVSTFDFIGLFHTNIVNDAAHTIRIRTADTEANLTAAPDYDSTATRAIPSGVQSDYSYTNLLHQITEQSNQWVRIDLVASNNTDAYISVGRVYVSKAFIPTRNMSYGWSMGIEDKTEALQALGGASHPATKPKTRLLRFSLDFSSESDMYGNAFAFDRTVGASQDIFVHRNLENLTYRMDNGIYGLQTSLQPVVNTSYAIFSKRYTIRELL